MTSVARVLVVATVTSTSDELLEALTSRGERGPAKFHLLMPAVKPGFSGRDAQKPKLEEALARWRAAGLDADGEVGDTDPVVAVWEVWDPRAFHEVIVSTLGSHASKWMQFDLPHRVERLTDAQVTHVVTHTPTVSKGDFRPVPERPKPPLGGLDVVLSWGRQRR
jgi:GABA permease